MYQSVISLYLRYGKVRRECSVLEEITINYFLGLMKSALIILFEIIVISLSSTVFSMDTLDVQLVNGTEFISINQSNLETLFNCSLTQFDSIAKANGFEKFDDANGVVNYISGTMGEKWQLIGKSGFFVSISWFDMESEYRLTTDLRNNLKGAPYTIQGKMEYYKVRIENTEFKLGISKKSDHVFEDVTFGLEPSK